MKWVCVCLYLCGCQKQNFQMNEQTVEAPSSPCAPPPSALWATLRLTSTSSATTAKRALRAFRYGMYPFLIYFNMLTKEQSFSLRSWSPRWLSEKKYELGRWRHSTEMKPNDWEKQRVPDLNLIFLGFKMKLFCSPTNFWCHAESSSQSRRGARVTVKQKTILPEEYEAILPYYCRVNYADWS